jgi:GT2 family glycosyltransferase
LEVERQAGVEASVIVPSHRGAHRIGPLLQSLVRQSFTGAWEVVVVVDGLVDDTVDVVESYASRLPLRVVRVERTGGVSAALNRGYRESRGRVLIRCDDDLTPEPHMVAGHVAWHARPGLHGVIGLTRDAFPDTAYARVYGRPANERAREAAYVRPAGERWIHWAAHNSLTRESWELVGGFDERLPYGEDSELGWRLQNAGVDLFIDSDLEIEHRGPAATAELRTPRAFVAGASRRVFLETHPDARYPAAGTPRGRARLWSWMTVTTASVVRRYERYRTLGAAVDQILPVLPRSMGGKLVALVIEAAGRAGERHGPLDLLALRTQKSLEVAAELGRARGTETED